MKVSQAAFESWHDAVAKGEVLTAPEVVFKEFVPDEIKAIDENKRQVRFRVTTNEPDRMKDTIAADGWDLKNFKRNPVILFSHQYDALPVARSVKIDSDEKGLSSVMQFATKDQYAFADTVYQLILGGFLKATSVGFKPQKHVFNEQRGGVDWLQQELLEVSICSVPANPSALLEADAKGIDVEPMREWAERLLDSINPEPGLWVPRRQVEIMLAALPDAGKTISLPGPKPPMPAPEPIPEPVPGKAETKGKPNCPRGTTCPANEGVAGCPEGGQCPMKAVGGGDLATRARELVAAGDTEAALALFRDAEPAVDVIAPDPTVRRLEIDEDDLVILELADEDDVDPDALRAVLAETIPVLVREALNKLRGRID